MTKSSTQFATAQVPASSPAGGESCHLLTRVFGDPVTAAIFSVDNTIESWLAAERALASAEAEAGLLGAEDAEAICEAAVASAVDKESLWHQTGIVGYPILPLVRMVTARLPDGPNGRVHYGATTQDIMDTGMVLQLVEALKRLEELLAQFGNEIARLVVDHRETLMPARTHGQQAVPTTFGAKLASLLGELSRQRDRLEAAHNRTAVVSLYGAGGTSAALGDHAGRVREAFAGRLGLAVSETAWHAARDSFAELGMLCAQLSASAARFATEVVNLSRDEIGEVSEGSGADHYGASSTMPHKVNPVRSECVIGMSIVAAGLASVLPRTMVVPHERAAGEWQAEWELLPQLAELAAGALSNAAGVARSLSVNTARMRANAEQGGLMLAEAYMMGLAPVMGREAAHDVVYAASKAARATGESLVEALRRLVVVETRPILERLAEHTSADSYVGEARAMCERGIAAWDGSARRALVEHRRGKWTN